MGSGASAPASAAPGAPVTLPADHDRPPALSGRWAVREVADGPEVTTAALLPAFQILLSRYTGQDVILSGDPAGDGARDPGGAAILRLGGGEPSLPPPAELGLFVDGGIARLAYSTDLFEEPTIRRMAGHLRTLLTGLALDPERRGGDPEMLTEAERHELTVAWNPRPGHAPRRRGRTCSWPSGRGPGRTRSR